MGRIEMTTHGLHFSDLVVLETQYGIRKVVETHFRFFGLHVHTCKVAVYEERAGIRKWVVLDGAGKDHLF